MGLRIPRHVRGLVVVLFLVKAILLTGCSKDAAKDAVIIGPDGGTIVADDPHLTLEIPPGALAAPTAIRILPTQVSRTGVLPGTAYSFEPDGLVFARPARLTLHPPPSVALDDFSRIVHVIGDQIQFDDDPTLDLASRTISAVLSGFSTHAVGSTTTLCPEGCPSTPVLGSAAPLPQGIIRLSGSCSSGGGGTTAELIVERAFVPALTSVVSEFQNWTTAGAFQAPPSDEAGRCAFQWDDADVCLGWTYAYRVRAHTLQVTTNASNSLLAIGPGTRQCTAPGGPDAGVPDAGPGPGGPGTVTLHTYQQSGTQRAVPTSAAWVGAQDGSGAFAPLSGQAGIYTFDVQDPAGRYGVAVACNARSPADARIIQATTIEGTDLHVVCSGPTPTTGSVTVETTSCASAAVSYGTSFLIGQCGSTTRTVETGVHDAVGVSFTAAGFDRVYLQHDVAGPSITIDFASSFSASPVAKQVTVAGQGQWLYTLRTPGGFFLYPSSPGSGSYPGFPASLRAPDDVHYLCTVDLNNPMRTGYLCHYFRDPIDVDDSNAAYAVPPIVTGDRTQLSWDPYLASGFDVAIGSWRIWLSIGWLGQTAAYRYPRLCDLAGFPLPCLDTISDTQFAFRAYKPAHGFAASLVDLQNAESLPPVARDGLTYSVALSIGSL